MGTIVTVALKIAVFAAIALVPIFLISSLFGKKTRTRGRSFSDVLLIMLFLLVTLCGITLILFGLDVGSDGSVVGGSVIALFGGMIAVSRLRRRR